MATQSIIFLAPVEGPLLEAVDILSADTELSVSVIEEDKVTSESLIQYFPCVVLSSSLNNTLMFMKSFKEPFKKTTSKFILACPEELDNKKQKVIFGLNVTDIIDGQGVNPKTISHKAKLHFKTLPKLEEEEKEDLKKQFSNNVTEESNEKSKRTEIDYETVDFMAVTKFCDSSIKSLNKIEELLEEYEERSENSIITEIEKEFEKFKNGASLNNFNTLKEFSKIPEYLCQKIPACDDVLSSVVTGILFNTADFLRSEVKSIKEKKARRQILDNPHKGIFDRYKWVSGKFVNDEGDSTINEIIDEIGI